jgi:hypothetical protein
LAFANMLAPFVARILSIGARPMALVETHRICKIAKLERCFVTSAWPQSFEDVFGRLMHQRWLVMRALLEEEDTPVVYAGMDTILYSSVWQIPTPMAFDMRVKRDDRIVHFTPDLVFARADASTFRFLDAVNATLNRSVPFVTSLPTHIFQRLKRHDSYLMGPAQQDALMDVLYQILSGDTASPRRTWLALKMTSMLNGEAAPVDPGFVVRMDPYRFNISVIPKKYFLHCLGKKPACLKQMRE